MPSNERLTVNRCFYPSQTSGRQNASFAASGGSAVSLRFQGVAIAEKTPASDFALAGDSKENIRLSCTRRQADNRASY